MKKLVVIFATILSSVAAQACPGAFLKLNDDTALSVAGLHDLSDKSILKLEEIKATTISPGGGYILHDSKGKATHHLQLLGILQDAGGIISVTYLLMDVLKNNETITLVVKSNYMGGGTNSRGGVIAKDAAPADSQDRGQDLSELLKTNGASAYLEVGCR